MRITRKHIHSYLTALFGSLLFVYIIYHTFEGRYSFVNKLKMEGEVAKGKDILDDLVIRRETLEHLVQNIDKIVDVNLLEEEARKNGLVGPGEIIIPLPKN